MLDCSSSSSSPAYLLTIDVSPVHVRITASNDSQELQSDLRHEHSIANGADAGSTNVLNSQPPFQQLSPSEQEELKAILDDDVRKMQYQFGHVVTKTCKSVEERIPVRMFAASILGLGAYDPAPQERDRSLLNEHREEIRKAESISEIFSILSAYWNYLNYEILEYTVDLHGTVEDEKRLENYNKQLHEFCKRRVFELPSPVSGSGTGGTLSPRQEKFSVKLNVQEDITCKELLRIRTKIARILHVNLATLVIHHVDTGCVRLTFLIPKFVAMTIFPLSDEQTSELSKDASVIKLDYVIEVLQ